MIYALDRPQLKREARAILGKARVSPWLVALLYIVLVTILSGLSLYVSGSLVVLLRENFPSMILPGWLLRPLFFPTWLIAFVSIAVSLLSNVLYAGWVLYHQTVRRGSEAPCSTLFDGFSFAGKVILLQLVESIFVALWAMLFVIPGIVAIYRYRFALYNLCENPEIGIFEAIGMSKAQTRGFKADLFILDLSFIGWNFLSSLTLGILNIYVAPYFTQTDLGFFRVLKQMTGVGYLPPEDRPQQSSRPQDPFGPY